VKVVGVFNAFSCTLQEERQTGQTEREERQREKIDRVRVRGKTDRDRRREERQGKDRQLGLRRQIRREERTNNRQMVMCKLSSVLSSSLYVGRKKSLFV
jgi:hypothetical protein